MKNKLHCKPGRHLVFVFSALCALGLVASIWPSAESFWYFFVASVLSVAVVDFILVYRLPAPKITRKIKGSLAVGVDQKVVLNVTNVAQRHLQIDVYDDAPEFVQVTGMPRRLLLDTAESAQLSYEFKPLLRGLFTLQKTDCLVRSPLGLWQCHHKIPVLNEFRVYPNYAPIIEYALLATENHLSMMGILKQRRRGQGMDFHQLREFREGDSIRQIDWKASSRMRKMITREYQEERDQQIIVMMDCGHRMLAQDGELSHFDHSLNALLLLSYVALRQGDAIGVSTFSNESPRWIKPVKGVANINTLLNGVYDLQPGSAAPDYSSGARDLILRQRKRSLVVILTNLRDDDNEDLKAAVQLLKKYHKVVLASLQEQAIVDRIEQPIVNLQDALSVASTHGYLSKREALVRQLRNSGINTLDVLPEDLALSLTNTYLGLKSSGQI